MPVSTQWEIVEEAAELIMPARDELENNLGIPLPASQDRAVLYGAPTRGQEKLADVLKRRAADLPMPIQMSDALVFSVNYSFSSWGILIVAHHIGTKCAETHQVVGRKLPRARKK